MAFPQPRRTRRAPNRSAVADDLDDVQGALVTLAGQRDISAPAAVEIDAKSGASSNSVAGIAAMPSADRRPDKKSRGAADHVLYVAAMFMTIPSINAVRVADLESVDY
jgi:hypothetical protein